MKYKKWTPELWFRSERLRGVEISTLGRVRSFIKRKSLGRGRGKGVPSFVDWHRSPIYLKPSKNSAGYLMVTVDLDGRRKSVLVHKLMCLVFMGPPPEECYLIRHLDDNKTNNRIDNLCYGTAKDNAEDARVNKVLLRGQKIGTSVLTDCDVFMMKICLQKGMTQDDCAEIFCVSQHTVNRIALNKAWKHIPWHVEKEHRSLHQTKRKGSGVGTSKLNESKVLIVKELISSGKSCQYCADMFSVSNSVISDIKLNKRWKHVPWPEGSKYAPKE